MKIIINLNNDKLNICPLLVIMICKITIKKNFSINDDFQIG